MELHSYGIAYTVYIFKYLAYHSLPSSTLLFYSAVDWMDFGCVSFKYQLKI